MDKKPRIASVEDRTILAAVRGYFSYDQDWQAIEMLEKIRDLYLRSKEQDDSTGKEFPTVRLWVSGYGITKDEKAQGYCGHYVRLSIQPAPGGRWTINAEKLSVPLEKHPRKARPPERHLNWGHPVLRAVESGKPFPCMDIARAQLQSLHQDYPDATIPGKDVVHVMIYTKKHLSEDPEGCRIEKITLKAKPLSDGSAKLMIKPVAKKKKKVERKPAEPQEVQGKFTALVKKKRSGKK